MRNYYGKSAVRTIRSFYSVREIRPRTMAAKTVGKP